MSIYSGCGTLTSRVTQHTAVCLDKSVKILQIQFVNFLNKRKQPLLSYTQLNFSSYHIRSCNTNWSLYFKRNQALYCLCCICAWQPDDTPLQAAGLLLQKVPSVNEWVQARANNSLTHSIVNHTYVYLINLWWCEYYFRLVTPPCSQQ